VHGFLKKELAPVLFVDAQKQIVLRMKYFSLCPDWAKTWSFEFETYNARLTRPKRFKNQNSGKVNFGWQKRAPSPDEISQIKVWQPV